MSRVGGAGGDMLMCVVVKVDECEVVNWLVVALFHLL